MPAAKFIAPTGQALRIKRMDGTAPQNDFAQCSTVAIIGGGFAGACLALNLARFSPSIRIIVFEPAAVLGQGLAYSTHDDAHRINAPAQRMSMLPEEPGHFSRWILETGACLDDAAAALPDGRLFPRRAVFGRYVADQLAPLLRAGRILHIQAGVADVTRHGRVWLVRDDAGQSVMAEIAVVATGHAPQVVPPVVASLSNHPGFITDPLNSRQLGQISKSSHVLMIGTGLTMADCVAILHRNGHTSRILAISRRGQAPQIHASVEHPPYRDFGLPPVTALALLRWVRAAVAQAAAINVPWQGVFDGLRCNAEQIWQALPTTERCRLLRHARPFWDTHRHRLPPPTADILRSRLAGGSLVIKPASIRAVATSGCQINVTFCFSGLSAAVTETFDAVVLTAGFGRISDAANGVVSNLLAAGSLKLDDACQGLSCDHDGRAVGTIAQPPLYVLGPPARGSFADITGVPEIACQAVTIARRIVNETHIYPHTTEQTFHEQPTQTFEA